MSLTLAAAQTVPFKGDVKRNMNDHLRLLEVVVEAGAQLIFFPELSLTGYEPELAESLAFERDDARLEPLRKIAVEKQITVIAGAPVRSFAGLQIGAFICNPNGALQLYTKHHLHDGEERFFTPGNENPLLELKGEKIALAICADITHPEHALQAANNGASIYLAGVFITPGGYAADAALMEKYALEHAMLVSMANYGAPSGAFQAGGRSAAWSATGKLLKELEEKGENVLFFSKD